MSLITIAEFREIIQESLTLAAMMGVEVTDIGPGRATARMPFQSNILRPGGTVSGPALMGLADFAAYAVVLSAVGRVELAVTTNLNINFLRKPAPAAVIAEGSMLKLGKRLAVTEVALFTEGDPEMVAHATATYSIPPPEKR